MEQFRLTMAQVIETEVVHDEEMALFEAPIGWALDRYPNHIWDTFTDRGIAMMQVPLSEVPDAPRCAFCGRATCGLQRVTHMTVSGIVTEDLCDRCWPEDEEDEPARPYTAADAAWDRAEARWEEETGR